MTPGPIDDSAQGRTLGARLRGYFFAGLLVAAPLTVTIGVALWFVDFVDSRVLPSSFRIPGAGLIIVLASLTLIGWVTSGVLGRMIHTAGDRVMSRIPILRSVYAATKQIFETVLAKRSAAFREVALFEYPRRGIWSTGFLTGTTAGEVQQRTQEETVNVFLPTTPNPTSGYLLFVPRKDLIILDMTVEDGIKMVVSGGIVTPPFQANNTSAAEQQNEP